MNVDAIGHVALTLPAVALVVYGTVQLFRILAWGSGRDWDIARASIMIGLGGAFGVAAWIA